MRLYIFKSETTKDLRAFGRWTQADRGFPGNPRSLRPQPVYVQS